MLIITNQPYNSVWIKADSQEELGNTFIRFQEHYESPKFRNQIFTLGQLKNWYSITYGADTYNIDWTGFNFPSRVLDPFRQGLFDPLTDEEINLLTLLKYRNDDFYVIGANSDDTLRHELSHALYHCSNDYRNSINKLLDKHKQNIKKICSRLSELGYHKDVIYDEIQAYTNDDNVSFVQENLKPEIIQQIKNIYNKHK
jgi:hypothetical protein